MHRTPQERLEAAKASINKATRRMLRLSARSAGSYAARDCYHDALEQDPSLAPIAAGDVLAKGKHAGLTYQRHLDRTAIEHAKAAETSRLSLDKVKGTIARAERAMANASKPRKVRTPEQIAKAAEDRQAKALRVLESMDPAALADILAKLGKAA